MIYYLPERIYDVLKDNEEVISILKELEDRFEDYDNFRDYISGYCRLEVADPVTKKLQAKSINIIKNMLHDKPILLQEFYINNGDIALDSMKNMYNFFDEKQGIDLENKFFLLSNIINLKIMMKAKDIWNTILIFMKKYLTNIRRTYLNIYT